MALILFAVAVLWIVAGAFLILDTPGTRRFYQERFSSDKVRGYAFPVAAVGAVLVIGAFLSSRAFWWPLLIGILAIAKGVYLRRTPETKLQRQLEWWYREVPDDALRLCGLVLYSLGAALLGYLF